MIAHRSTRVLARTRNGVLALVLAAAAGIACNPHVDGNGVLREEDWTGRLGSFEGVFVEDGIEADVTVGGEKFVRLSGDENVVTKVQLDTSTDAETGVPVLHARIASSYTSFHPLRVTVTVPTLTLIHAVGDSDDSETAVNATGVLTPVLRVRVSDHAHATVQGAGEGAGSQLIASVSDRGQLSGVSAELDAFEYRVAVADVTLSDGARAWVNATESVIGVAPSGTSVVNTGPGACLVTDGQGQVLTTCSQ